MTNHTPGPWSADKWAPGYTVSAPTSGYSVCHLEDCNNEENNARLIAAAPDLLAALRNLLESTEWADTVIKNIGDQSHFMCNIREARAAISRAEGN